VLIKMRRISKLKISFLGRSLIFMLCFLPKGFSQGQDSGEYVNQGWEQLGKRNFEKVYELTDKCIAEFKKDADKISHSLRDFPPQEKEDVYKVMNDVATCYFIKGEALMREGKIEEAVEAFNTIIEKYPYAQAWDPRGWFWSLKEKAEITLKKLKTGIIEEEEEEKEKVVITKIVLADPGKEFPVNYENYGKFSGLGTKDYKYLIENPEGLSSACGEGVYPNTTSFRYDPEFIKVKKRLFKLDHWKILNSRDLSLAFYKWNICGEPWGVKQFYLADLLERSGLIKQAIKAYYAVVVHFPQAYGKTYWGTPWYIGRAAITRIKYLLKRHPELGLELKCSYIKVINGFDHDVSNDIFIVNPGRFVKKRIMDFFNFKKKRCLGKVKKEIGSKVKLAQYESGDWRLLVDNQPFIIKGITYAPTRVGESPDEGTLSQWMTQDINNNGLIDAPFEAWVDKNRNNKKDEDEKEIGDFTLLKKMGVNCIRIYHQPHKPDKQLLRKLYKDYGIMVIMGDFLGKYTLGSGAEWSEGTDYSNPEHQENMLKSVREMVEEFKDEPYILIWVLGNENVYGLGCNADKDPESFAKFLNRAAKLIKELDPARPVGVVWGDTLYLDVFSKYCPDVDIFGTNAYRGKYGFGFLWSDVKEYCDKPVVITEFGAPAYAQGWSLEEAEDFQAEYHQGCWEDIQNNLAGYGEGNALGGIVFEWLDEWWKAYEPFYHDKKGLFNGPFLDGYMHEEWLGLCSQGDGRDSPFLRQLRKAYFIYKRLWK